MKTISVVTLVCAALLFSSCEHVFGDGGKARQTCIEGCAQAHTECIEAIKVCMEGGKMKTCETTKVCSEAHQKCNITCPIN